MRRYEKMSKSIREKAKEIIELCSILNELSDEDLRKLLRRIKELKQDDTNLESNKR